MKPVYEHGGITLYEGRAEDVVPVIGGYDVVVTDPPYGFGLYASDTTFPNVMLRDLLTACRSVAIFGYPELLISWCVAESVIPREWITWWPTNGAIKSSPGPHLLRESECIAVFGDVAGLGCLRQPRDSTSRRIVISDYRGPRQRGVRQGDLETRQRGDVWTDPAPGLGFQSAARLHPNEKPLGVMCPLVDGLSNYYDTILDPYMGSGTTLVAAKQLGRKAIGIEIEPKYIEIAIRRLEQEVLPMFEPAAKATTPDMFAPPAPPSGEGER